MSSENLVVFDRGGIAFVGEQVTRTETELVLRRVIVLIASKDGNAPKLAPAPYASRDSEVTIPINHMPGIIVTDLDFEMRKLYQDGIVKAYSNLVL